MTRRFSTFCLALVLAALAVPVAAQNKGMTVSIPYDFTAGGRKLAAGQYLISHPTPNDPRVFSFRGDAKHQKVLVTTNRKTNEEAAAHTVLNFARYGDAYFLRDVRVRGEREVYTFPTSAEEKASAAKGEAEMVALEVE